MKRVPTDDGVVVFKVIIPINGKIELGQACSMAEARAKSFMADHPLPQGTRMSSDWTWKGPKEDRKYPVIIFSGKVLGALKNPQYGDTKHFIDSMIGHLHRNVLTIDFPRGPVTVDYGHESYTLTPELVPA
ncbi:MAG: hypothetical protein JWM46_710 [Candidatus Kaiserbacteria bacterium]|nr:hypothetical protein [Candidatus Kaiserbacteria bacterium]